MTSFFRPGQVVAVLSSLFALASCNKQKPASEVSAQAAFGARFDADAVWQQVKSDPYKSMPNTQVSLMRFSSSRILGVSNPSPDVLTDRAVATIFDSENIVKRFDKLVHPNGICLKGRWVITEDNIYSGAFKKGTNAPFVGRASVAFSDTTRDTYRAFGFAGKIFMENGDQVSAKELKTANFFTIDDLAGTLAKEFGDLPLSNEPAFTKSNLVHQSPSVGLIGAATIVAFSLADSNPGIRQLYQISELGEKNPRAAITPKWMHLKRISKLIAGRPDFRQDLRVSANKDESNFQGNLEFQISVSSTSQTQMRPIGKIVLDDSVVSDTCDHRLHFNHPKFREDLKHR